MGSCLHPRLNVNARPRWSRHLGSLFIVHGSVFAFVFSFHPNYSEAAQLSLCISNISNTMWRRWCLGFCLCRTVLAVPSTACPDVEQGTLQVPPGPPGGLDGTGGPARPEIPGQACERCIHDDLCQPFASDWLGLGRTGWSHEVWISSLSN